MIEQSLFQSNFVGRDGFKWWIGQVADPETSGWAKSATLVEKEDCHYYRVKVRILGYHPTREKLADKDLPFAHVLIPLGQGTGTGWIGETHDIQGGESVIGFFADGDDCQQPIIFGAFYRPGNQVDETFATGEDSTFKRFSGKKTLPENQQNHLSTAVENSGGTNVATGQTNVEREPTLQPPGLPNAPSKAMVSHAVTSDVTVTPPSPCENNDISRIQTFLTDFMKKMRQIQEFLDSYVNPILNELVNIDSEIRKFAKLILGVLSNQIAKLRDFLMSQISKAVAPLLASLFPKSQQPALGLAKKTILDLIYCLFEQLISFLFDIIKDLLRGLLNKLFDIVQCLVDDFLNDIFSAIDDFVTRNISPILAQINALFGGQLGNISGIVGKTLGFVDRLLDLLTSCNSDCPSPSSWSASNGLNFGLFDDFGKLIDGLNGKDFGPCDTSLVCSTTLSIFGGGGLGAMGEPIISGGRILGVNLIDSGVGYTSPPTVSIIDNCGGYGGRIITIIDPTDGGVVDFIVEEPGNDYTDGGTRISSGIFMGDLSGNTSERGTSANFKVCLLSKPTSNVTINLTVLDVTEGFIDKNRLIFTPQDWNVKQTVTVTGIDDSIVDGDVTYQIKAVSASSQRLYQSRTALITITNLDNEIPCSVDADCPPGYVCRNGRCVPEIPCSVDADCPPGYVCRNGRCVPDPNPNPRDDGISPVTKCGFIAGVIVKSIGENYSSKDTVTVLDLDGNPIPEVKINLVFGPNNSIIAAEIRSSAIFCGYLPTIVINTNTGYGAILKASMRYQGISPKDPESIQKISIVDCVSR